MINLNVYETTQKLNKTKTWLNVNKCQLLSREIKFRKYYTISIQIDPLTKEEVFHLILVDDPNIPLKLNSVKVDDYGRLKFNLNEYKDGLHLTEYNKNVNISIIYIEGDHESDVYLLEF